jgi:hypothetical protein
LTRILSLAAALSLIAASSAAQAPAGPAIDRLIAALPDRETRSPVDQARIESELARLLALNPGESNAIRPILEAEELCGTKAIEAATLDLIREVATQMGAQKVGRLTKLYEGEDEALLDRLMTKSGSGEPLTDLEVGELGRIFATYPFAEFRNGTRAKAEALDRNQEFVAAVMECKAARDAAYRRARIRSE